jgi:hypothetical protein
MRFHQLSNKPISQGTELLILPRNQDGVFLCLGEFQRAVRISTGFELESNIIGLIFRIFDADDDQHL